MPDVRGKPTTEVAKEITGERQKSVDFMNTAPRTCLSSKMRHAPEAKCSSAPMPCTRLNWKIRAVHRKGYMAVPMPFIPGSEVSGVGGMEAADRAATKFNSDEVFGAGSSSCRIRRCLRIGAGAKAQSTDLVHAAAISIAALTGLAVTVQCRRTHCGTEGPSA
jgi:hypothetical protein